MRHHLFKIVASVAICASLITPSSASVYVMANETESASAAVQRYALTDSVEVEVKSVLNERTASGTRIGVVLRLFNSGDRMTRVPEYALRVKTSSGNEYTLRASESNAAAIQPQEKVELSYVIVLDRNDDFSLTSLYWVDIDEFEYPIKEKTVLTIPVTSQWNGNQASLAAEGQSVAWKQPFAIPVLSLGLRFTPIQLVYQNSAQGPVAIVALLAENKGVLKETLPAIQIDGNSDKKVYHAKRIAPVGEVTIEPGEKQQLFYAIPLENDTVLKSLTILNQESFVQGDKTVLEYNIGRLTIRLDEKTANLSGQPQPVSPGGSIPLDPLNNLIQQGIEVSMVELHMHGAEGEGYQMAIAKFKLKNQTDRPLPVPPFMAELRTAEGYSYIGARQSAAAQELAPNLSYVISYSFNLPNSEKGSNLTMNLLDGQSAAPYRIPIASYQTQIQKETDDGILKFYPFESKLNYWTVSTLYDAGKYRYKMNLDLDIKRLDNIVVDQNFSKMRIELADSQGRVIGSETVSFTGVNRLVSGKQSFMFENIRTDQLLSHLVVNIYESIDTPFGEARRLVKTAEQR
ncbi:hypothetical protein ACFQI7_17835 [Paenibacillus allorhizosphaerae]|uniref:DUF4139 domain-containing protein n=1 Tax=Paenibacillus allorhizosphaerae TaxID=2849866 RepID=A0ABN7TIH9_9BACL|nr:hypothetical protein [Paenibacillus allorhizosphaerae]CAG7632455.1 hypothetical protein PAECIP111802_01847 [Paenibacillus allorhizosphaerae]